jgi:uroporphyrinogen-III synthase
VNQPLTNRRILVTRGASQAPKLSDGLRALGAIPIEVPVLEIVPPDNYAPLDAALGNLAQYDWLILTSTNTVRILAERAFALRIALAKFAPQQVGAVGAATAQAARDAGFTVSLVPESYVAESLVAELQDKIAGKRVLLARASIARDVIPDALRDAGAIVDVVDAYQNVVPAAAPQQLRHAYARGLDAATFASSSSVTHLAQAAETSGVPFPLKGVRAISIGPVTSQTLREFYWPPAAEADPHDIPGLIAAVVRHFAPES